MLFPRKTCCSSVFFSMHATTGFSATPKATRWASTQTSVFEGPKNLRNFSLVGKVFLWEEEKKKVCLAEEYVPKRSIFRSNKFWRETLSVDLSSFLIRYFRRLGDSRVYRLRRQNLERNFGLSWFRENRKMQFSSQMVLLFGKKVVI